MKKSLIVIVFVFLSSILFVSASPTNYDFIKCNKISMALLEHCLQERGIFSNDFCWEDSKKGYKTCRTNVMKSYSPDKDREKAMRMREEKRKSDLPRE